MLKFTWISKFIKPWKMVVQNWVKLSFYWAELEPFLFSTLFSFSISFSWLFALAEERREKSQNPSKSLPSLDLKHKTQHFLAFAIWKYESGRRSAVSSSGWPDPSPNFRAFRPVRVSKISSTKKLDNFISKVILSVFWAKGPNLAITVLICLKFLRAILIWKKY